MKKIICTDQAPAAIGTYSQAVQVGNTIYISGQIPLDPKTMQLIEGDFNLQVKQVISNLTAVITAAGATLSEVVKLTIFLRDMNQFPIINKVMENCFEKPYPARAVIEVSRLPKDAQIEMDAVVVMDK